MGKNNNMRTVSENDQRYKVNGVISLAQQAIEEGATKEEITEALRVAQHLSGVGCVYTAAQALKELFAYF